MKINGTARMVALSAVAAVVLGTFPSPGSAGGHQMSIVDNETQPAFDLEKAILETVSVDTGQDTGGDGITDRVYADVYRPGEGRHGLKSPVVLTASPYHEGNWPDAGQG